MFTTALAEDAARVQARLQEALPASDLPLLQAMRYATRGGKGMRGFLVMESARMLGADAARALPAAAAVEALHAYSLIHDDLPAMDDDDLRRGQPTVHVKWDEATAILAGDALQTLAFELLTDRAIGSAETRLCLIAGLAHAAGATGMVLGQALDMEAEAATKAPTLDDITRLQAGKTGALIIWSAEAGATIAGADPTPLRRYAAALGLAFQIADDILDVTGDMAKAGKRLRKDTAAGKATFVSLLGLDGSRAKAKALVDEAETALEPFGPAADILRHCARFVIAREM